MERLAGLVVLSTKCTGAADKTIPALAACRRLERLCVVDTELEGVGAGAACPSVRELELRGVPMLRDIEAPVACFAGLETLVLEDLDLVQLPEALGDLPLRRLEVKHCRWLRALPRSLARLHELAVLHVVGCPLDRATHESSVVMCLAALLRDRAWPSLRELDVGEVRGLECAALADALREQLPRLESLFCGSALATAVAVAPAAADAVAVAPAAAASVAAAPAAVVAIAACDSYSDDGDSDFGDDSELEADRAIDAAANARALGHRRRQMALLRIFFHGMPALRGNTDVLERLYFFVRGPPVMCWVPRSFPMRTITDAGYEEDTSEHARDLADAAKINPGELCPAPFRQWLLG